MPFLLITTVTHPIRINHALFNTRPVAIAAARTFVGEHNPIDGCSTKPVEHAGKDFYNISRDTSFGHRSGAVHELAAPTDPIPANDTLEVVA